MACIRRAAHCAAAQPNLPTPHIEMLSTKSVACAKNENDIMKYHSDTETSSRSYRVSGLVASSYV
eukprot:363123-Chlamydomonas_euryale.AAC.1